MEDNNNFDPMEEMKQIKQNLRRRNRKIIGISVTLALVLVLGIVSLAVPAVESLYWDPKDSSTGNVSDLTLSLRAYTELFLPGWNLTQVYNNHTGFAAFDLNIARYHVGRGEYDYHDGSLIKNMLGWGPGFLQDLVSSDDFDRLTDMDFFMTEDDHTATLQMLESMPEYITLQAAVSFGEDLTMDEILKIYDESPCTIAWVGIRNRDPSDAGPLYCGIAPFTGNTLVYEGVEDYPHFFLEPMGLPGLSSRAGILEQHFISLLAYSADQLDAGRGARVYGGDRNYYREVLEYVEENGIKSYGVVVFGTPQQLLALLENEQVTQIKIMDAWIDVK